MDSPEEEDDDGPDTDMEEEEEEALGALVRVTEVPEEEVDIPVKLSYLSSPAPQPPPVRPIVNDTPLP